MERRPNQHKRHGIRHLGALGFVGEPRAHDLAACGGTMHFARTRVTPPSIPAGLVPRPALLDALDRGDDRALTLVCAPPGYGKSLLLSHWVRERADDADGLGEPRARRQDPRRLWGAVLTALRACPGVPADSRLHRLVVSRTSVELEFLAELVDALDALPMRIRLVLDDAHNLVSPGVAAWPATSDVQPAAPSAAGARHPA